MREMGYDYRPGGAYGLCQRCGFQHRLSDLRREWSGLLVCDEDYDPRPDTMRAPVVYPEGLPKLVTSPDTAPEFITARVTPDQL